MADWVIVISLVALGIIFIIVEILFVPGTTIVGILGIISTIFGVYLSFLYFGSTVGVWFAVFSTATFALGIYISFKQKTWDRFSLKDTMTGKFNEGMTSKLEVAQRGIAVSTLRPFGKAEFGTREFEVRSFGDYVDSGTEIEIVKIAGNTIYVQPIK
jgi:membrane-bound ClpP family serine protease